MATIEEQTMEKEMVQMEMEISNTMCIPNDIIIEILSWVPANSLLRLRWTCKYWFDLITRNPDFVKTHLHRSTTSDHNSSVLISGQYSSGFGNFDLQCYLNYTTGRFSHPNKLNVAFPFEFRHRSMDLTCINGLLFFFKHELDIFCIWNPCTKEYRVLPVPVPPIFIKCNDIGAEKRYVGKYGFGYDHKINDYKVVRNDYYYDEKRNCLVSDVQVYTLGTNSWRSIGPVPYKQPLVLDGGNELRPRPLLEGGVFVNGALHWLLDSMGKKIVSFDIGKEQYKEVLIEQPKCSHGVWLHTEKLQVIEGSLCCLVVLSIDDPAAKHKYCFEMWMMSDYDVNNNEYSWTKLFRTPENIYHPCIMLRLTKNGEILMLKQPRDLVLYDPKTDTTKTLSRIREEEEWYHMVDAVYTESLVSLNSGTCYTAARLKNRKRKIEGR